MLFVWLVCVLFELCAVFGRVSVCVAACVHPCVCACVCVCACLFVCVDVFD